MKSALLTVSLFSLLWFSAAVEFDRTQLSWGRHPISGEVDIEQTHSVVAQGNLPVPECIIYVHDKTPDGPLLDSSNVHGQLYYKIVCEPADKGKDVFHCVQVSNCTVGNEQQKHMVIDENGCTNEPWLFEDVEYLDDLVAGVFNPFPVRFRGKSATVRFHCVTKLQLKGPNGCGPRKCTT